MRIVFFLVLLLGLGLAGAAAYMVMNQMQALQAELDIARRNAQPTVETTTVAVATRAIPYGVKLTPDMVRMVEFPVAAIPRNSFTSQEAILGIEGTEPRSVIRRLDENEVIMQTKVTNFGQDAGLRSRLDVGMRAFTINVDVTSGVSGFIRPGDRVDIIWTAGALTKLILENVTIIAIDQSSDEDSDRPQIARTITVQVTPEVVAQLAQAQNSGRLSLSLRGVLDQEATGDVEFTQDELIGREIVVQEAAKVCTIRIRKGAETVEVPTDCPEEAE